ncbi:MAG: hypothetical protein AMXMBFR82_41310 [Candidatus Hydrogenedentota bacterium]
MRSGCGSRRGPGGSRELRIADCGLRIADWTTDIHGHTRTYTDIHGLTRTYTDLHGLARTCTDLHGLTRTYTDGDEAGAGLLGLRGEFRGYRLRRRMQRGR